MTIESTLVRRLEKKLRASVTMPNVNSTMTASERTAIAVAIRAGRTKEIGERVARIADRYVRKTAATRVTEMLADNALSSVDLDELFT